MFQNKQAADGRAWRAVAATMVVFAARANAVTVPFTEDFAAGSANWRDNASVNPLTWQSTGGPDGGGFARTTFNFQTSTPQGTPALFRAQQEFGSSGGAFFGDWIADGVTEVQAQVRHDADRNLTYFGRFASPFGFPAMAGVVQASVPPNEWILITLPITASSLIAEGPSTFDGVFTDVGRLQFGVAAGSLAGVNRVVTLDIDKVSVVPEPATIVLLGVGAWAAMRRTRRGMSVR